MNTTTNDIRVKVCTGCGQSKPITEFHKSSGSKDGYHSQCKECRSGGYRRAKASMMTVNSPVSSKKINQALAGQGTRLCCDCGQILPLEKFSKNMTRCRDCSRVSVNKSFSNDQSNCVQIVLDIINETCLKRSISLKGKYGEKVVQFAKIILLSKRTTGVTISRNQPLQSIQKALAHADLESTDELVNLGLNLMDYRGCITKIISSNKRNSSTLCLDINKPDKVKLRPAKKITGTQMSPIRK